MNPIIDCLRFQSHAEGVISGMTQLLSKHPGRFSRGVWPGYYRRARGVEIEDLDGNKYLDFSVGGIGATVLGYADPDVNAAVCRVIADGSASSFNAPEEVLLADRLLELHPWAQKARFARSGGEAMALAVRIARAATGKSTVVFCGYHGWHDWYLAANLSKSDNLGEHLIPGISPVGVPRQLAGSAIPFHFNDIQDFKRALTLAGDDLAAVVMEPMRNFSPERAFIDSIHEETERRNVPLVMDEISAGFRVCIGGMHRKLGYRPDLAVFAKALGNGFPISAVIGKTAVMEGALKTFISSTNWTERCGPAAALAVIDKFERMNVSEHLVSLGQRVKAGWQEIAARHRLAIEISGIDPMLHLRFQENHSQAAAFYTQEMLKRGFLAGSLFYAMYAHTFEQLDKFLENTDAVWRKIASGNYSLEGQPAENGFQRIN